MYMPSCTIGDGMVSAWSRFFALYASNPTCLRSNVSQNLLRLSHANIVQVWVGSCASSNQGWRCTLSKMDVSFWEACGSLVHHRRRGVHEGSKRAWAIILKHRVKFTHSSRVGAEMHATSNVMLRWYLDWSSISHDWPLYCGEGFLSMSNAKD